MGCPVIIHNTPFTKNAWTLCSGKSFTIGPEVNYYHCFYVANAITKSLLFSVTAEFMHNYITVKKSNCIIFPLNFLSRAVKYAPVMMNHEQLTEITNMYDLFCN